MFLCMNYMLVAKAGHNFKEMGIVSFLGLYPNATLEPENYHGVRSVLAPSTPMCR